MNVTDSDGDTPLYTVEDIPTAQWLVQHGAIVDRRNVEGITVSHDASFNAHLVHLVESL